MQHYFGNPTLAGTRVCIHGAQMKNIQSPHAQFRLTPARKQEQKLPRNLVKPQEKLDNWLRLVRKTKSPSRPQCHVILEPASAGATECPTLQAPFWKIPTQPYPFVHSRARVHKMPNRTPCTIPPNAAPSACVEWSAESPIPRSRSYDTHRVPTLRPVGLPFGLRPHCACRWQSIRHPAGDETVLRGFTGGAHGSNPQARLVFGPGGELYAATAAGESARGAIIRGETRMPPTNRQYRRSSTSTLLRIGFQVIIVTEPFFATPEAMGEMHYPGPQSGLEEATA